MLLTRFQTLNVYILWGLSFGQTFVHAPLNPPPESVVRAAENSAQEQRTKVNRQSEAVLAPAFGVAALRRHSGVRESQSWGRRLDLPRLNLLVSMQTSFNFGRSHRNTILSKQYGTISTTTLCLQLKTAIMIHRGTVREKPHQRFFLNDLYTSPSSNPECLVCADLELKKICRATLSS